MLIDGALHRETGNWNRELDYYTFLDSYVCGSPGPGQGRCCSRGYSTGQGPAIQRPGVGGEESTARGLGVGACCAPCPGDDGHSQFTCMLDTVHVHPAPAIVQS